MSDSGYRSSLNDPEQRQALPLTGIDMISETACVREYGLPPYRVVVIHGGPGARGEMAPVASELGQRFGVIEPLQEAASVGGQEEELKMILQMHAALPATLVGHSWGAWLSLLLAARHPDMVEKILLVATPPLEQRYVAAIDERRLERFTADQRREWREITSSLAAAHPQEGFVVRLAELAAVADNFDPIPDERNAVDVRPDLFRAVWHEAAKMRRDGSLLATVRQIRCPVVAIHGEDDPHPAAGVQGPLATALGDFRFLLIPRCGHTPWIERQAQRRFYDILDAEIRGSTPPIGTP